MYLRSARVTAGGQPARSSRSLREPEAQEGSRGGQKRGQKRGRSVSPVDVNRLSQEQRTILSLPSEIMVTIFSYTRLADRPAQQLACQRFRAVGNIPGVVERQIINTCKGVPPALHGAAPGQPLATILKKKTGVSMARSQPAHLLLAGYLKVVPSRCLKTLTGHIGQINGLTRLENGQFASCSDDRTIRIWDPETGQCLKTLGGSDGHTQKVRRLTPLGNNQLASCSNDMTIKVWNVKTGQCLKTLAGHADYIRDLLNLGNGQFASCSSDGTIKVWDPETGQCLQTLDRSSHGHQSSVSGLVRLGNEQFASCSEDETIKIWNQETWQCLKTLAGPDGHTHFVLSMTCLADGMLASYAADGVIKIWNPETGQLIKTLSEPDSPTTLAGSMCSLGNGQIVIRPDNMTVKIWDVATGQRIKTLDRPTKMNLATDVISLGNGRFASSRGITIKIWGYGPEKNQAASPAVQP